MAGYPGVQAEDGMRTFLAIALMVVGLAPAAQAGTLSLAGSEWGLAGADAVVIQFAAGGKVAGNLGCNRFGGGFRQKGAALRFTSLMGTRMACPGPAMATEARVSAALDATRAADISHLKLVLKDGAGHVLLTLQRRDWD